MALSKFAITRGLMSGGMNSRHKRRELMRFNREVDKYNLRQKEIIEKSLVPSKTILGETTLSETSDDRLVLNALPKLKNLQLFLR